ncbi:MAG TPA: enolase C-terminal domain-like protein [Candidatus Acidoferrales bacterium]|nr:enolase C-terminal domain-like protein [Candidatus Acidoferrales bacterium]
MRTHASALNVASVRVRKVLAPMRRPLAVATGDVKTAPLVLVDVETDGGPTGSSYVFVYAPFALEPVANVIAHYGDVIRGSPLAPVDIEAMLQSRLRLIGAQGITLMALAAVDMALWDALARSFGVPLATLLGSAPRPIPAYNSNGLGIIGPERAPQEARELLGSDFRAVKVRLGYPEAVTDLAVVRAVRGAIGRDAVLMADYNQALSSAEAMRRGRMLDDEHLLWLEEPVDAHDARGHAQVRAAVRTAIQTGENWWGPHEMGTFIDARVCDYAMPDAMKIGGVTGWLRAAALAEAAGIPMSSHLYPEISAHLLAATPTRHWLEYVDWAQPVLRDALEVKDGHLTASSEPGSGIAWNEDAIREFEVR